MPGMGTRRGKTTFARAADEVLRLKQVKSERTQKNAAWQIARLKRAFGRMDIQKIDEVRWTDYIGRELARRPRKFFDDRKHMRMILRYARKKRWVREVIDLPIPDVLGSPGRELSARELARLEKAATPNLRFQIRIAWRMGLRLREILRLRWEQIDFERQVIRLSAQDTKTRKARDVPIPPQLLPEFRRRGVRAPCQWVFWNPTLTGPVTTNARAWRRAKRVAGIKARFHDLRHTCASILDRERIALKTQSAVLGASAIVLSRIYHHVNERDLQRVRRVMGK
jgi:integrase